MGHVFLAGEEPHKLPALLRDLVTDRSAEDGIPGLECVEDGALRGDAAEVESYLA